MTQTILSSLYFPPVQYFTKLISSENILIEIHDNYIKQTYRNRCEIYGPNGKQELCIPVVKNHGIKTKVKDIQISYIENWQKNHFKSIETAYRSAPFYEYYIQDIEVVFNSKQKFLIDLNQEILTTLLELLEIDTKISFTNEFYNNDNLFDFREVIHPKRDYKLIDKNFIPAKYHQVFSNKHGFIPNLSILDLLFNEGPNASEILNSSISPV